MRRGDNNHSSSLNNFQQVRKQDFQTAGKSTSKGPQIEASRTPAKLKKPAQPSTGKKNQQQYLSQAKILNQSLGSAKPGSTLHNTLGNKLGSIATPSQKPGGNIRRVGIHQGSTDLSGPQPDSRYSVVESRQMINSPVKQRVQGRNKDDQRTFPSTKKPSIGQIDSK